jgi:hypothetical protein
MLSSNLLAVGAGTRRRAAPTVRSENRPINVMVRRERLVGWFRPCASSLTPRVLSPAFGNKLASDARRDSAAAASLIGLQHPLTEVLGRLETSAEALRVVAAMHALGLLLQNFAAGAALTVGSLALAALIGCRLALLIRLGSRDRSPNSHTVRSVASISPSAGIRAGHIEVELPLDAGVAAAHR